MPRTFLDGQAQWFPEGSLAELPDIDGDPERFPVIGWELEPGDAVCFHMLTLHAAGGVGGDTAGGCCRCASSATTWCTPPRRLADLATVPRVGRRARRRARRSTIRCSRSVGRRGVTVREILHVGNPVLREPRHVRSTRPSSPRRRSRS